MREVTYKNVKFAMADEPDQPVFLVFGVRKSGSSVLNSIVEALANHVQVKYVDVAGNLFKNGIAVGEWQADEGLSAFMLGGNVLAGFRDFPAGLSHGPEWVRAKKILLVRDPRDALVSEYFSNSYSHVIPDTGASRDEMLLLRREAQGTAIEKYVVDRALFMVETLSQYLPLKLDPSALVLHYEDFVGAKGAAIGRICGHFGWVVSGELVEAILQWADVQPEVEDPRNFIRKVTPGDHREKLSPAVIRQLNDIVGPIMERYGYQVGS